MMDFTQISGVQIPGALPVRDIAADSGRLWRVYDAEVEYIEATGNQYIDTGIGITPAYRVEADFEFTQVSTKQQRVFEQYDTSGHLFAALYLNGSGKIGYAWDQNKVWSGVNVAISARRRWYVLDGPNRLLKVGATEEQLPLVADTGPPDTATLKHGSHDTGTKPTYGKWYSAKISLGGVLVRDLHPVRCGSVGCLYDRVSGTLFPSLGADPFLAGADI